MGVVHQHRRGVAGCADAREGHGFEAAGHRGACGQVARPHVFAARGQGVGGGDGLQGVHQVVRADQRQRRGKASPRAGKPHPALVRGQGECFELDGAWRVDFVGYGLVHGGARGTHRRGHGGRVRRLGVDHRGAAVGELAKQLCLGRRVGVHRAVVVQVVLREVGEHRRVEGQPRHTALVERVAADFHHRRHTAVGGHAGEDALQLDRAGGGQLRGLGAVRPAVVDGDGAQQPAAQARGLEQVLGDRGDGGFAVGAGDAHQLEPLRGVPEEARGQCGGQRLVDHGHDGQPHAVGQVDAGRGDHGRGPRGAGGVYPGVPAVVVGAAAGDKEAARADLARVVGDVGDRCRGGAEALGPGVGDQVIEGRAVHGLQFRGKLQAGQQSARRDRGVRCSGTRKNAGRGEAAGVGMGGVF